MIEGRAVERASGVDPRAVLATLLAELPLKQAVSLATKITGGKTMELHLKLTKAGKRVIRLRRSLPVTLFAYAQDAAKNNGTAITESRIRR